jgi:hypothetical protein
MATVVKNESGIWNRALMLAAMEGRLDVCRLLVEDVRVDVNQPVTDDEGSPASTRSFRPKPVSGNFGRQQKSILVYV